jgi:hypothetical protein
MPLSAGTALGSYQIVAPLGMHESDGVKAIVMELVEGETLDVGRTRTPSDTDGTRATSARASATRLPNRDSCSTERGALEMSRCWRPQMPSG